MGCQKSKVATPAETMGLPAKNQKSLKNQRTAMVWESETESTALASGAFATEVSEVNEAAEGEALAPAELTPIQCEEEVAQENVRLSQSEDTVEGLCGFCY
ncbi:unnamed protein product [Cladocopium goreaui]|uniref:Uncharacterized protein n=1 Tax=Cladocopium goreaui TaxID=2562237 RepID=A0A9P1C0U4_9DINO|nr:unnamed protein product [Cladocopium goreaui]|mmetsp:Transcript_57884/g.126594  ORF Transcript_57884/g.126594 Transcript_57884/m.126594 type:complete len:101 (-) Transcript_57884:107-409(-)